MASVRDSRAEVAIDPNVEAAIEDQSTADANHRGLNLRYLPVVKDKPRPSYYRMANPGPILRSKDSEAMPSMVGHFCVFNRWTHIDSWLEGEFMERVAPGSTRKTIEENRSIMKVLFNHGKDPSIGMKVLGPIEDLREDEIGGAFLVPLLDTSYNRDLIPGLEAKQYGTSYRFKVMQEKVVMKPDKSDYNPEGIPERTIEAMEIMEFGPVTFPQYQSSDVGLRSITDDILGMELFEQISSDPERLVAFLGEEKMRMLITTYGPALTAALSNDGAEVQSSLPGESRDEGHEFAPLVVIRNTNRER